MKKVTLVIIALFTLSSAFSQTKPKTTTQKAKPNPVDLLNNEGKQKAYIDSFYKYDNLIRVDKGVHKEYMILRNRYNDSASKYFRLNNPGNN